MRASRSSKTAAQMALSRAIEACEPASERICDDPFARRFLGRRYRALLAARPLRRVVVRLMERLFAGHHHYVLARTRHFDDFLSSRLGADVRQLVILGAGFDSRAYRFADRLRDVAVFEVDHPATSAEKRAKVEAILGRLPPGVRLVPVDFNRAGLEDCLGRHGYGADLRTIFLWEGTVPYLSPEAVDETLRFVVSRSGAGSSLIFDYVLRSLIDGTCDLAGASTERARMSRTPEPLSFGIAADAIAGFMTTRGFRDIHDAGAGELKAGFPVRRAAAYVKPWWRIVQATVP